ncbi:MAG TPA: glycosyltransferase family 4 protein [Thermoanaerobaculia bacterium]|nr:glycosyltransferase family 4 protein [Thermoanaerobaculia bacterium]
MNTGSESDLAGVRVVAALNGLELFGHERGNIEVFKALRREGAEVTVGINARDHGGDVGRELARLGFETFLIPFNPQWSLQFLKKHPRMIVSNPWAVARCSARFRRVLRRRRATHVHLGSPLAYSYVSAALATTSIPLIYRMGDNPPLGSRFNLAIWNMAMRRATRVVAISEFVRRAAIDAGVAGQKIETIYNTAPSRGGEAPAAGDERPVGRIVYVGAVSEEKGLIPLVEAVAALSRETPQIRLDVVGGSAWDGSFRRHLRERIGELGIADRVVFHGHVDDPAPFFRAASVHVAPSICAEGLGNVVIEAKQQSTPSVVFPSGGLPEMIHHGVDGYICPEPSAGALVEALRWMLAEPVRLTAMGAAARASSESKFGEARFTRQWAVVYGARVRAEAGDPRVQERSLVGN